MFAKVMGGIFAMIIAPVLATIGASVLQKKFEKQIDHAAEVIVGATKAVDPNPAETPKEIPPPVAEKKQSSEEEKSRRR